MFGRPRAGFAPRTHPTEGTASPGFTGYAILLFDEHARRTGTVVKMLAGQCRFGATFSNSLAMQRSVPTSRLRCVDCTGLRLSGSPRSGHSMCLAHRILGGL